MWYPDLNNPFEMNHPFDMRTRFRARGANRAWIQQDLIMVDPSRIQSPGR